VATRACKTLMGRRNRLVRGKLRQGAPFHKDRETLTEKGEKRRWGKRDGVVPPGSLRNCRELKGKPTFVPLSWPVDPLGRGTEGPKLPTGATFTVPTVTADRRGKVTGARRLTRERSLR